MLSAKYVSKIIVRVLYRTINNMLETGIFSDVLKIEKVYPILEGGERNEKQNSGPLSVLAVLVKLAEGAINKNLTAFCNK